MSSDKSSIIDKAQKLAAKGQISQAIAEWQRLIAETPNDGNIYNTIGDLHLKANQKGEATASYLKAADAFKTAGFELKSIAVYKKIIKVDPSQMEVYEKLADVHAERGLTANAVEDYLKVAKHYVKQNDFLSALSVYRKLANLDPQNSNVRLKIAEMCQKQGLEKEAVEEYEKVLEIYDVKKMTAESKSLIEQILKIDPNYKRKTEAAAPEPVALEPVPIAEPAPLELDPIIPPPAPTDTVSISESTPLTLESLMGGPSVSEPLISEPISEPAPVQASQPADEPPVIAPRSLNERMDQTLSDGDWDAAEKILDELTEAPVALFGFLSRWFDYYLAKGILPKAFLILQKVVGVAEQRAYFSESRAVIKRYLDKSPRQVSAHQLLAENFEKAGETEEAIECHSKVLSILAEQRMESARAYYEKLKSSFPAIGAAGKWKELFEPEPIETAPQMEIPIENPVNEETSILDEPFEIPIEEREKDPVSLGVENDAEEVAVPDQISEPAFKGHLTEADVYIKYGLYSKAIEQLLLVSELCPLREEPHLQLKEIYLKQGMTEKAIRECWVLSRIYGKKGAEDKKNEILRELTILDPEGQYKEEIRPKATKVSQPAPGVEQRTAVKEKEESGSALDGFNLDAVGEEIPIVENEGEVEKSLPEQEEPAGLQVQMGRVDQYLSEGNRDAAKSLLWKILEKYPNCAEARLKLLEIQEVSKSGQSTGRREVPATVDLSAEGMDETSFEGLSEVLERSFSGLISKEGESPKEAQADAQADADERLTSLDKAIPTEDYVDLAAIFSEDLEEEEEAEETSLAGLEDTVLDDAFKDFQKGIKSSVDDQDFETHYNLGIAYKEMGLLPEAIKEFELAFQGDLRFQDASMMLASCYRERGMTNMAIDVLTNALSDPRCKREHVLAIKYELATIYDSEGDKKKAKILYEEVSALDPTFRDVLDKSAAPEAEPLVKSIPSAKDAKEEGAKRNPAPKKKNKISYL